MMIATAEKQHRADQVEFDIDFEREFPPWDSFPIYWLAQRWHCTAFCTSTEESPSHRKRRLKT